MPAQYAGQQARLNVVGTFIDWDALELDPRVIIENSKRITGRIKPHEGTDFNTEPVAIVGFGPSLHKTWEMLEAYKTIYTCSGAHKFLLERGIVPTYHVDSDPRAYKSAIIGTPHNRVTYLIASSCHPTYFDKLEWYGSTVKLWHILFPFPAEIITYYPEGEWIMTGGHTVGARTIKMARIMGYTNLHIFGMDASLGPHGMSHANEHPNFVRDYFPYSVDGHTYMTNDDWEKHAKILLNDLDHLPEVSYQFHGEGLMQTLARRHHRGDKPYLPLCIIVDRKVNGQH